MGVCDSVHKGGGGLAPGGSAPGGSAPGGGGASGEDPPGWLLLWAVRIQLECILVFGK